MSVLLAAAIISIAGALGGMFNSIVLDGGFVKGGANLSNGKMIWNLGFFSNILCGGFAAFISWGLYGSLNTADILQQNGVELTLAAICGAALTGFSGASWLTTQADKNAWKTNTIRATQVEPSPEVAARISTQSPQEARRTLETMPRQIN
jgi:hypothetical protein